MEFLGLEIGPDVDWSTVIRRRLVDRIGWMDRSDTHHYNFFDQLIAAHPEYHRPLVQAMADLLTDPDPTLRGAGVTFLFEHPLPSPQIAGQLTDAAAKHSDLYLDVPNPLRDSEELFTGLVWAILRNATPAHAPTVELMHVLVQDPAYSRQALQFLMDADPKGLFARLPELLSKQRDPRHNLLDQLLQRMIADNKDPDALLANFDFLEPAAMKHAVTVLRKAGIEISN